MKTIRLNSFENKQFIKEILEIPDAQTIEIEYTDSLAKNISLLFTYLKPNTKTIIITKTSQSYDIICAIEFSRYLQQNYLTLTQKHKITFQNFTQDEIFQILSLRNYLIYTRENNTEPCWDISIKQNEKDKQDRNSHLQEYEEYNICLQYHQNHPFSYFDYPKEENNTRFVFHFYIYSDKTKENALKLLNQIKITSSREINKIIKEKTDYEDFFEYAIGISYDKDKITRTTIYLKLTSSFATNHNKIGFFKTNHNLSMEIEYDNLMCYAIDFYENITEFKFYYPSHTFRQELNNKQIEKIFKNKRCTKVLKVRNNNIIATKYEFEFAQNFLGNSEKQILKEHNLYTENTKILAIYIKSHEIIKKTLYDI